MEVTYLQDSDIIFKKKYQKYLSEFYVTDFAISTCDNKKMRDSAFFQDNPYYTVECFNGFNGFAEGNNLLSDATFLQKKALWEENINPFYRVAIKFDSKEWPFKTYTNCDEVEFGNYPQDLVTIEENDVIIKTENKISIYYKKEIVEIPVYMCNKDLIVNTKELNGEDKWYLVEPIKWYIDRSSKKIILKDGLLCNNNGFKSVYLFTDETFLNKYFLNDIRSLSQSKIKYNNENRINILLNKISESLKNTKEKELITEKVNKLIEDYNNKIDSYIQEYGNDKMIMTHDKHIADLYTDICREVSNILDYVIDKQNKYKNIYEMVEILNSCKNNTNINEDIISFINDIKRIINYERFFTYEEKVLLTDELTLIIDEEIHYLMNLEQDIELKELKIHFRNQLQSFLVRIMLFSEEKNILDDINKSVKDKINDYNCITNTVRYLTTEVVYIKEYINSNGNQNDIIKMNNLISNYNDNNYNIKKSLEDFNKLLINLYRIRLDIDKRNNDQKILERYKINIKL